MTTPNETSSKPLSDQLAETRTDLAVERTVLAADRTLMAWIRTSISMIGFGFTLYKFLQYLGEELPGGGPPPRGARNFGLAFIAFGVVSLILAAVQHWRRLKRVDPDRQPFGMTDLAAGVVALLGVLAFANLAFRIGPF
jgi:putative membrane protein